MPTISLRRGGVDTFWWCSRLGCTADGKKELQGMVSGYKPLRLSLPPQAAEVALHFANASRCSVLRQADIGTSAGAA